jgi:hypothetical protein
MDRGPLELARYEGMDTPQRGLVAASPACIFTSSNRLIPSISAAGSSVPAPVPQSAAARRGLRGSSARPAVAAARQVLLAAHHVDQQTLAAIVLRHRHVVAALAVWRQVLLGQCTQARRERVVLSVDDRRAQPFQQQRVRGVQQLQTLARVPASPLIGCSITSRPGSTKRTS